MNIKPPEKQEHTWKRFKEEELSRSVYNGGTEGLAIVKLLFVELCAGVLVTILRKLGWLHVPLFVEEFFQCLFLATLAIFLFVAAALFLSEWIKKLFQKEE